MPDLDIVAFWCCETALHDEVEFPSNSQRGTYTAVYEQAPPGHPYGMRWRCAGDLGPCWPYRKHGACIHTEQAEQKHCGWDQFMDSGNVLVTNREPMVNACPRCGGPVTAQRYGV